MTRTTPLRRTILQLRQILFTDALTFILILQQFFADYLLLPCFFRLAFFNKESY
ncbi:MAG: hypothetical protein ACI9ZT_001035 [Gammaproteobacteria bacterium]|jgi:hypothetical protein